MHSSSSYGLRSWVRSLRALYERHLGDVGYLTIPWHRLHILLLHGPRIRARRSLIARQAISPMALEIAASLETKGYYLTSLATLGGSPAVLEYCRALSEPMANKSIEDVAAMRSGKSKTYWLDLFEAKETVSNPTLDFITLPVLLQAAARYLGEVPILTYVSLFSRR